MKQIGVVGLILVVVCLAAVASPTNYIKGISFGALSWPTYDRNLVTYNLYRLADLGLNSIAIHPTWFVETHTDSTLEPWYRDRPGFPDTNWFYPTLYDHEIEYIIETAHSLGMSVMLKLYVAVLDNEETMIGAHSLHPNGEKWDELFESYQAYADHYATMSEQLGVEILCLGTELNSMTIASPEDLSDPERRWRVLISNVRKIYSGELTYSCAVSDSWDHPVSSPSGVTFWDALDYIGIEFYRGLSNTYDPSLDQLRDGVRDTFTRFVVPLVEEYNRPVLIPEINFMHCDGVNMNPYSPDSSPSLDLDYEEHADCYEAVISVIEEIVRDEDYFKGIYWWSGELIDGRVDPEPDLGTFHCARTFLWGTPAEDVVRSYWQGKNAWRDVSSDLLPFVILLDEEAFKAGCSVKIRQNIETSELLVEAVAGEGWFFESWAEGVDLLDFPIAKVRSGYQEIIRVVFRQRSMIDSLLFSANIANRDLYDARANYANVVVGTDEDGPYYGMEWSSPDVVDLDIDIPIGAAHGATCVMLTLSASEELTIKVFANTDGPYCGDAWSTSVSNKQLEVSTEPQRFILPRSSFAQHAFLPCNEQMTQEAFDQLAALYLLAPEGTGELRVYDISFCHPDAPGGS